MLLKLSKAASQMHQNQYLWGSGPACPKLNNTWPTWLSVQGFGMWGPGRYGGKPPKPISRDKPWPSPPGVYPEEQPGRRPLLNDNRHIPVSVCTCAGRLLAVLDTEIKISKTLQISNLDYTHLCHFVCESVNVIMLCYQLTPWHLKCVDGHPKNRPLFMGPATCQTHQDPILCPGHKIFGLN